jgi:crotonobetaine/carnitine-CoA ligase
VNTDPRWPGEPPGAARVIDQDIVTVALDACRRDPEVAAIRFEDGTEISRADFLTAVDGFAAWLHDRIAPGDRVAIVMHNRIEFMVAWIAIAAKGAILVSVNHDARRHDALHVLGDSGARVVLADAETHPLVAELAPELPDLEHLVLVDGPEPRGLEPFTAPGSPGIAELRVDPAALTNVYYTSGTTGPPKGCMLGHDYWIRFTGLYLDLYGMGPEDRLLCCLQFFYGDPPWQLLASLRAGTTLIAMRRFSVSRFWDVVRENDVTQVFGLASIPALLLSAPPDPDDRETEVRFGLQIGIGKELHAPMVERWGFPWMEGYGLTETGLVVGMPPGEAERMIGSGSIGLPVPGAEIAIRGEAGEEVEVDEPGEIWIKAPGLFKGYLNRPEATAEALVDGWMRTGDLGRRDHDGFLYFLGRRKDIIRRSGENVAAAEVEQVLRAHPSVLEAAVVAVPDELRGEEVKAYVGLVEGESPDTVPPRQLIEHCAAELATYKVPRYIAYREEFPRTPSMRVRKSELITEVDDLTVGAWDRETEPDSSQRR